MVLSYKDDVRSFCYKSQRMLKVDYKPGKVAIYNLAVNI